MLIGAHVSPRRLWRAVERGSDLGAQRSNLNQSRACASDRYSEDDYERFRETMPRADRRRDDPRGLPRELRLRRSGDPRKSLAH